MTTVSQDRAFYSELRLAQLRSELASLPELQNTPKLTIFGAGSFARLEASQYSDIDLFFLSDAAIGEDTKERTNSYRVFGKILQVANDLGFPDFSNDGEYLEILRASDILVNLGNRTDDHKNYFTARMLMLLESRCLYGDATFNRILSIIIRSYFKDYPGHQENFQPTFLINDISRYWKTILLNYENKRPLASLADGPDLESKKTKNRVRNFKVKFSRLTTCYATVAAIGSFTSTVKEVDIIEMVKLTPRDRLIAACDRLPAIEPVVRRVLEKYESFQQYTGMSPEHLESHFSDTAKRTEMFSRANEYGDLMYSLIELIDKKVPKSRLLRTLVV